MVVNLPLFTLVGDVFVVQTFVRVDFAVLGSAFQEFSDKIIKVAFAYLVVTLG